MGYQIEYFCASHPGKRRKTNQDNFFCGSRFLNWKNTGTDGVIRGAAVPAKDAVFAVFDGMGGAARGEMAAYIAAKHMSEFAFQDDGGQDLLDFCQSANTQICRYAIRHDIFSMGTTAAILKFSREKIWLCNIGDSKIFCYSDRVLHQLSKDHILSQPVGGKPCLLQNLGIPKEELLIEPYLGAEDYRGGDLYLICSDGLSDPLPPLDMAAALRAVPHAGAAEILMRTALDRGGRDNITLIVLYVTNTESNEAVQAAERGEKNVGE